MILEYDPKGVCSYHYTIEIDETNDTIKSCKVFGGCAGNLLGISKIITGMNVKDVIEDFEGVDCHGKGTSCPDQIAKALKSYLENK